MTKININTADKLAAAMRAKGFEVEVSKRTFGHEGCYFQHEVSIMNPMPEAKVRTPFFRHHDPDFTLLKSHKLGFATIKGDVDTEKRYGGWNEAEYSHWTKKPKKIGYDFTTGSEEALIANMKRHCTMPTQEQYDAALERARADVAKSDGWDRDRKIAKLVSENGKRAMEVLLEANVEIPEDLRAAMGEFMDLTS